METITTQPHSRIIRLSAGFLLLSGIASLVYQVTWVRLLMLSIGSTSVSVSIVLASFFLGLSLGSYLTTRLPKKSYSNLKLYLFLEAIIGISALILLPLLLNLDQLVIAWPVIGHFYLFKIVLVILLLALPCLCIGATYPLMANIIIREQANIGERLGWLYSMNTIGAVIGAISVGFVLIPHWGLDGAIYIASALNASIVIVGWLNISLFDPTKFDSQKTALSQPQLRSQLHPQPHFQLQEAEQLLLYFIMFTTGFVALACEVGWTKYLSIFTHTTIYGFSAILAIFLMGIAAGAMLLKHFVDDIVENKKLAYVWLTVLLCLLALTLTLARVGLEYLPHAYQTITASNPYGPWSQATKYILSFFILILPTLLLGTIFTLNMRLLCQNVAQVHSHAGKAYAINTLGGILGSVVAGLWLIPQYGTNSVLILTALFIALLPLLLLNQVKTEQLKSYIIPAIALICVGTFYLPDLDYRHVIKASGYYFDPDSKIDDMPEYPFIKEGRSGVISVSTYDRQRFRLQTNSLPEAVIAPPDKFPWQAETLLGLLPYLLHEKPKHSLLIGLGAGTTASAAALTNTDTIKIVELEPAIAQANNVIFPAGIEALEDPRVELVFNDARHTLLTEQQKYDAIISQPSHPWLAGNANLFTLQYFQLINSRLQKDGVFVQWLNLFNMDAETLASILKSFYQALPYGMSFIIQNEYSLILVGSRQAVIFDLDRVTTRLQEPSINAVLKKWNLNNANDLLRLFSLTRTDAVRASAGARPNTDTNLLSEIRLSTLHQYITGSQDPVEFLKQQFSFDFTDHLSQQNKQQTLDEIADYYQKNNNPYYYQLTTQLKRKNL